MRDIAWNMFQSIVAVTETRIAYFAIADVTVSGEIQRTDSMEVSFYLQGCSLVKELL